MPDYGVASVQEMDAAAALLKLHCDPQPQETKPLASRCEGRAEMTIGRGRAMLNDDVNASSFINRLSVKVTSTPLKSNGTNNQRPMRPVSPRVIRVVAPCSKNNGYIVKKSFRATLPGHKKMSIHDMYLEERKRWSETMKHNAQYTKSTRDVGTQTEEDEIRKEAEEKLVMLTKRIKDLEDKLHEAMKIKDKFKEADSDICEADDSENTTNVSPRSFSKRKPKSSTSTIKEEFNSDEDYVADEDMETDDDYELDEKDSCRNTVRRQSNGGDKGEMVQIGCGNASVPARVLRQVNWGSYTSATRKLLTAIFPRSILATHSLTGKPSPAFPNKPAKKKLNPALVDDIIQTVVQKCNVPESIVRTSITTKCADESKMFRSRQNKKKTSRVSRKENDPPGSSSSSAASR